MFHHMGLKGVRHAASAVVLCFLGSLVGCGGGGGGGDAAPQLSSSAPTLQSIEVTPSSSTVAAGTTQQFMATGLYTDNSTQDLTTQVTWHRPMTPWRR